MNVYKVGADLAWGILLHLPSNDDRAAWRWDEALGKPSANNWQPSRLENPRGKAKVLPTDCVSACMVTAHDMLLSAHAREALAPLLLPFGEFLPVQLEGLAVALEALDYCWFNCTTMADIADQDRIEGERSKYRLEPPNCWNSITRWSFHLERVATAPVVFTVPQDQWTLMCTDMLRQAVEAHDLLGFQFDLLWSAENGGVEINNSIAQFMGESGRQRNIAAKARRKAMQARLKGRLAKAVPTPS